jgi:hypothetical protein
MSLKQSIATFFFREQFLHKSTDIEDMSNRFTHKYLEIVGRGIPSRLVRIRLNDKPWFNSEIRKEIRTRAFMQELFPLEFQYMYFFIYFY